MTTGHHIILLPKLAPSWDRYTSRGGDRRARPRSARPCPVRTARSAHPAPRARPAPPTVRRRSSPRFISVPFRAGQELLRLLFHALLENAPRVLVAVHHRARQGFRPARRWRAAGWAARRGRSGCPARWAGRARSARSQAGPSRVGVVDVDAVAARGCGRTRRSPHPGRVCEAANFGAPSIARISQVTWLRSLLCRTATISRGSAHCGPVAARW